MADLSFALSERRNFTAPILIAVLVLILAGAVFTVFNPYRTIHIAVPSATVYAADTEFARQTFTNGTHVVGQSASTEHDIYVIANVHIEDPLRVPLFLKDLSGTITAPDGAELHTTAIEKGNLDQVVNAFPNIKPLLGTPLFSETTIAPGQSAEGTVLLQFSVPKSVWDTRKSASVTVGFYHQDSVTVPLPKS